MGEGKKEYAKHVCAFCFRMCALVGIVFAALILIFIDPILKVIGASADTWEYAKQYLTIVAFGGPFVLIANCYANIIRSEGKAGTAMIGQLAGNLFIRLKDLAFRNGIMKNVLAIGIPASIGDILMSVSNIVANALAASYGDMAVAGFGVAMKVTMITGMFYMFSNALQAMGAALSALIINFSRQGFVYIPCLYLSDLIGVGRAMMRNPLWGRE